MGLSGGTERLEECSKSRGNEERHSPTPTPPHASPWAPSARPHPARGPPRRGNRPGRYLGGIRGRSQRRAMHRGSVGAASPHRHPPSLHFTSLRFTSQAAAGAARGDARRAEPSRAEPSRAEPSRAERGPEREPRREWGAHGCCDWPRCQRRPLIGCGGAGGGRLWRPGGCDGVRPAWPPLRFVPFRPGRVVCGR